MFDTLANSIKEDPKASEDALAAATAKLLAELQAAPKRPPYQDRTGTAVINSVGR